MTPPTESEIAAEMATLEQLFVTVKSASERRLITMCLRTLDVRLSALDAMNTGKPSGPEYALRLASALWLMGEAHLKPSTRWNSK